MNTKNPKDMSVEEFQAHMTKGVREIASDPDRMMRAVGVPDTPYNRAIAESIRRTEAGEPWPEFKRKPLTAEELLARQNPKPPLRKEVEVTFILTDKQV